MVQFFRCTPEEAGVEFVNLLVALKRRGAIVTATQVCQLCSWAAKAEIKGPAKQLALQPSAPTGHFSRKFDTYAGAPEDEEHYHIDVVSYNRADATRSTLSLPTVPAHEALVEEMGRTPNMYAMLAETSRLGLLPRCYYDHKLAKRAEDVIVLPLCLYVDGIQYTDRDNLISFYVHNVATDCRHLVVAIRKNDVCKCGCKGWCSIWGIHTFLRWTFRALAAGVWPDRKHDGHEWTDDYQFRASFANAPLGLTARPSW